MKNKNSIEGQAQRNAFHPPSQRHAEEEEKERVGVPFVIQSKVRQAPDEEHHEERNAPPRALIRPGIDHFLAIPQEECGEKRDEVSVPHFGCCSPNVDQVEHHGPIVPNEGQQEDAPRGHYGGLWNPTFPLTQRWNGSRAHYDALLPKNELPGMLLPPDDKILPKGFLQSMCQGRTAKPTLCAQTTVENRLRYD